MDLESISKQITQEIESLSKKKTDLQKESGLLESKIEELEPIRVKLLKEVLDLQAEHSKVKTNSERITKELFENIDREKSEWREQKDLEYIVTKREKTIIKDKYDSLVSLELKFEEQKKQLEKDQIDLLHRQQVFSREYVAFDAEKEIFEERKQKNYEQGMKLEKLSSELGSKGSQIVSDRLKADELLQSATKDRETAQKAIDELRIKTGEMTKYSNDIKIKDKTLSAKSVLLFKKEQSLKEREIRLEDRESVLRTNLSL